MAFSAQQALKVAQDRFYAETRFADVFATCKRAPLSAWRATWPRIDGVSRGRRRASSDAGLMDVPGLTRPATARLISLPDDPTRRR